MSRVLELCTETNLLINLRVTPIIEILTKISKIPAPTEIPCAKNWRNTTETIYPQLPQKHLTK